jgi:hypothetical protein
MRFQKGMPRPANAGRKKGSLNKKKFKKVAEVLAEHDICLVADILDLIINGDLKDKDRLDAKIQLLAYCQAKTKEDADSGVGSDDELLEKYGDMSDEDILRIVPPKSGCE